MAGLRAGPVSVRVPASSANLGPGFDALGLALGLYDVVTAEVTAEVTSEVPGEATASGGPGLEILVEGEGAGEVPLDENHLVYRCLVRGLEELGVDVPPLRLHCVNAIPHGRGLGSSSAAIVGGLALARALVVDGVERWDDEAMFEVAAELEGHPDNVAPAALGGLTVAYGTGAGFRAARLDVAPDLAFVVFVPPDPLATTVARGLLPDVVPHADAARNAGRAALLVAALTGHPEHLFAATEDALHQGYRAPAMPGSAALISALRANGVAAVVSGAGPTVLAVVPPGAGARPRRPRAGRVEGAHPAGRPYGRVRGLRVRVAGA